MILNYKKMNFIAAITQHIIYLNVVSIFKSCMKVIYLLEKALGPCGLYIPNFGLAPHDAHDAIGFST